MINKTYAFAGILAVCGAATYPVVSTVATKPPPPLKISDLTLTRSIRMVIPFTPNGFNATVVQEQLPPNMGIAITEIGGLPQHGGGCSVRLRIQVNGGDRASIVFPYSEGSLSRYEFNPPVIVRPGETLTFTFLSSAGGVGPPCYLYVGNDVPEFSIGGWRLEPGEV